jgi:glycerophosphoryl diester phosphodiesterase
LFITGVIVALIGIAYWWATGGIPTRAEEPTWLTQSYFAHRGLHAEGSGAPENSLESFRRAVEAGYGFELDVQLTSDGQVVVMHDADLERMAGDPRLISDTTSAEIAEITLLGSTETVPTLTEALAVADGAVPVLVEIKNEGVVGELEDEVARQLAAYEGPVAVISFNPYSLSRVAQTEPDIIRGQLSSSFKGVELELWKRFLLSRMLMNWTSQPDFIAYHTGSLPSAGTTVQKWRGRPLIGWTPTTIAEREEALEICDNVICDPGALETP